MKAVVLLSGALISAAVISGCDSGVTEVPFLPETSPTPTDETAAAPKPTATSAPTPTSAPATPTAPSESGGLEGFREFAALIDAAVAQGDGGFFADRGVEEEMTCTGDEQLGPCSGQPAGTVLRGIPGFAWQSDASGLFSSDEFSAMLEDWFGTTTPELSDEYGDGEGRLFALAQRPGSDGEEEFLAITTGIPDTGPATEVQRQVRVLRFDFSEGVWRLRGEIFAAVSATSEDWLSGTCKPGCYDDWERWEGAP